MRRGSRHTLDLLKRFCRLFFAMVLSGNATLICYLSITNFTLWATYSYSGCLALSRLLCIISHPPSKVNRFLQKKCCSFYNSPFSPCYCPIIILVAIAIAIMYNANATPANAKYLLLLCGSCILLLLYSVPYIPPEDIVQFCY